MNLTLNGNYPPLPRHTIDALGVDTSYYEAKANDDRPVIVLLHGMSSSGDSFRETIHELSSRYRLIAPDIPGFGRSQHTKPYTIPHLVEWLASFLQALDARPAHLVGHSFGGILAAAYALTYPDDVASLILLAPAILRAHTFPVWARRFGASSGLMKLGTSLSRLFLEQRIKAVFYGPERLPDSLWQRRRDDYADARASADVLKTAAFYDLRPRLDQLRQPTCLIWGLNDTVVPPNDADILQESIPHAEVHKLDACGHAPMLERPEQFLAILVDFLDTMAVKRET